MDGEGNTIMSRPIDFMEPSFASSVADETSVHHNIDNLISDYKINSYYKNSKEAYYGKPYKYYANLGEEKYRMSIPLNMAHYADIIEKTNLPKSLSPVIEKYLPGQYYSRKTGNISHGERIERNLLNKLRKGDVPGGLVAYYQPWQRGSDDRRHDYDKNIGGYYKMGKNTTSPDTIKIFADAHKWGDGSTITRSESSFGFVPPQTGVHPEYGKWSRDNKASGRYGTALHEPIHGIKFPRKVAGMKHMMHTDKAGMKKFPGFSQSDYNQYVKEMAKNLKSTYGGEILKRQLDRLLKGKTEHKESVMVQDVFDDLFPDDIDAYKLR